MEDTVTWRTLFSQAVRTPQERQRLAQVLGVSTITITRWATNKSQPRLDTLRILPDALPSIRQQLITLVEREYPDLFINERVKEQQVCQLPSAFYSRFFHDYTYLSENMREASLFLLVVQQLVAQLDPRKLGLAAFIAQCTPPSLGNKVRSLLKIIGRGTAPWADVFPYQTQLFGVESQVGNALQQKHTLLVQNRKTNAFLYPQQHIAAVESVVTIPILQSDRVAGCLCVISTQSGYFSPSQIDLLKNYADMLAIAFVPDKFYSLQDIELGVMPPFEQQQPYLATFQQRVLQHLKESTRQQILLSRLQAERLVWQEIESLFLHLPCSDC